jgi:hypothetical protein
MYANVMGIAGETLVQSHGALDEVSKRAFEKHHRWYSREAEKQGSRKNHCQSCGNIYGTFSCILQTSSKEEDRIAGEIFIILSQLFLYFCLLCRCSSLGHSRRRRIGLQLFMPCIWSAYNRIPALPCRQPKARSEGSR